MTAPATLHGGDYDIARSAELHAELDAISPHSDVVLDLASTSYLDCSSLGIMVARLREWQKQKPGTQLRLRNVNSRLAEMIRVLRLDRLFIIE